MTKIQNLRPNKIGWGYTTLQRTHRMSDDIVPELDRWLGQWDSGYFAGAPSLETIPLVQRARDEIVALRAQLEAVAPLRIAIADALAAARREARDEALEEAARIAEYGGGPVGASIAKSIRALKEERDE